MENRIKISKHSPRSLMIDGESFTDITKIELWSHQNEDFVLAIAEGNEERVRPRIDHDAYELYHSLCSLLGGSGIEFIAGHPVERLPALVVSEQG